MSISEIVSYDKDGRIERFSLFQKFFLSLTIILVALLSFGIGRLSMAGDREPIRIEYDPELTSNPPSIQEQAGNQQQTTNTNQTASAINAIGNESVVVSKNGARYHYPHCAGAKQIKEENKIVFPTPAAAEAAGYTLAANCKPK